ncbi:mitochondrial ribosome small subunit component [Suhomyces tanzawaensis NRRL Y-17324]|uniref:Small ribosomal subunit protein mS33 n=1 Tax=Suhomyces tanzawaensis NRRL Y-17324 TaxID=984487 RepID=A0A1E4SDN6_9ASCO|nr:mitochondrial ribosome small subunit component [Suhomyces tanzawaensis NRRL Y-17324]ODV77629.1 mitochondrial ribosome small subunit component [Suhomyces tanzawaensis NRRL Y-17324]
MSSILKKLPSKERINQAKQLSASIFGHAWNPSCARNGAKILKAPLKGPEVVNYYGVNDHLPTFQDFKAWFPELKLTDPRETYRLHMVQDRKKRNKGAPKKKSKSD